MYSIDFKDILNNNYVIGAIVSLLAYLGSSFLNIRLSEFFKAFVFFMFSKYQHWIYSIFGTLLLFYLFNIPFDVATLLSISVVISISFILSLRFSETSPTLIYFGTFYENDKSYLNKNFQTERIDLIIHEEIEKFNQHSYLNKLNILYIKTADIPRFYIILKNLISINNFFKKSVKNNIIFGFSFFVSQDGINYKNYLNADSLDTSIIFKKNLDAIQEILDNNNLNEREKITLTIKINLMIITQSFNDIFLKFRDLSSLNFALQDNFQLLIEVKQIIQDKNITSRNIILLINNFECSYYRYKAILEFEKNNYKQAISYIFKSLDLNPYFPYDDYESFKRLFTTRYYLEITSEILNNLKKETEISELNIKDISKFYDILLLRIENNIIFFTIDIFNEYIMGIDLSDKVIEYIEEKLTEINDSNIAKLIFKVEALKILPKGDIKFNNLYVQRLRECILVLNKIHELDNSFSLISYKIGILKLILGIEEQDDKLKEEGIILIKLELEELKAIGLDLTRG